MVLSISSLSLLGRQLQINYIPMATTGGYEKECSDKWRWNNWVLHHDTAFIVHGSEYDTNKI